jgi:hypothetical protein
MSKDCTLPGQPSSMKEEKEGGRDRKVSVRRRPKWKRPGTAEAEWETLGRLHGSENYSPAAQKKRRRTREKESQDGGGEVSKVQGIQ